MSERNLPTDPYKGTRDFYPEDMAIQSYIFSTWAKTAGLFGFERYDASVLEPSELYKSKGAENEEMVNEQTYTFIDRGDREVTLRPEMTPTAARMIAAKRRELSFPVRWYSIPNLFRYERPQRGRLREHWQLNCDMFGVQDISADIEMIALAANVLTAFGATPNMFTIRVNDRAWLNELFAQEGLSDTQSKAMLALLDRKEKISDFDAQMEQICGRKITLPDSLPLNTNLARVVEGLAALGITNVIFSPSTVRGFSYYTGTIFELFDTSSENNRALMGGGRYDNLTGLFGGEPITGIGFGMGDVTMRDFLETHNLLPDSARITAPTLAILPTDAALNLAAQQVAAQFRTAGIPTSVDFGERKIAKKIGTASEHGTAYVIVVGEDEQRSQTFTMKTLATKEETSGTISDLIERLG